jgi:hypothetical protein
LHGYLAGWDLIKIVPHDEGGELLPWDEGERLELPAFQIVARRPDFQPPEFEFFLNEIRDGQYCFRRDTSILWPFGESYLRTEDGIPILAPEIQLLYKAKHHRAKDEHDFRMALDSLGPKRRKRLREMLELHRPGDPWLQALSDCDDEAC